MSNIEKLLNGLNKSLAEYENSPTRESFLDHLKYNSDFWNYKDKKCYHHSVGAYYKHLQRGLKKYVGKDWGYVKSVFIFMLIKKYNVNLKHLQRDLERIESFHLWTSFYIGEENYYIDKNNKLDVITYDEVMISRYEGCYSNRIKDKPVYLYPKIVNENLMYTFKIDGYKDTFGCKKGIYYYLYDTLPQHCFNKTLGFPCFRLYDDCLVYRQLNKKQLKYFNLKNYN